MPRMFYQTRNDKAIATCDPVAQVAFTHFLYRLSRIGESVLVTEGYRDKQDQEHDFAIGTSKVHFPYSFHNNAVAIDLGLVLFGQTLIVYNSDQRYRNIAEIAKHCNIDWGYAMWDFDMPHFQYTQGHPIEYFINGGKLDMAIAKSEASAYYNQQVSLIMNALKFANPNRITQLQMELTLVNTLLSSVS